MENKETRLSDLLKEKFVELDLKADNKPGIIAELVGLIGKSPRVKNKKSLSKAMLEREKLGSTAIGNGAAIPHVKTDGVKDFILAFARKSAGVDFESLDGEKTYIFFVLASPKDMVGPHLKTLASISRLVKDKFTVELLRKAAAKKDVLKIIAAAEVSLSR